MTSSPPPTNPFVGPRPLEPGEKLFGRDREVHQLLSLLIAERIVLLHSPSGAGKSSLVQAGLIPRLEEEGFRVLPVVRANLELPPALQADGRAGAGAAPTPGANRYAYSTLVSLQKALPAERRLPPEELACTSLAGFIQANFPSADPAAPSLALIFDQFEEVLTVDPGNQGEKLAFFNQLGELLLDRGLWVLFAMREDYVAALAPYLRPLPTRLSSRYRLDLLAAEAALQAVQQPVAEAGVEFTAGAAWQLVDDLRRVQVQQPDGSLETRLGPYVEPMQLQVVGYRLWEQRSPTDMQITSEDLAAIGSVDRALADYYAQRVGEAAAKTGVPERAIREWVERRLITESGIRGQVVMGRGETAGLDNRAVRLLQDAHLVRAEQRGGATWFELSHDRLIAPVREDNDAWFRTNLSLLQRQAGLWEEQGRPGGLLFADPLLSEAEGWAGQHEAELTPGERDFLAASRAQREQTRRTAALNRRVRALAVISSAAFVVAGLLALLAWGSYQSANRLRQQADLARATAEAGQVVALTQEARAEAGEMAAQQNAQAAGQSAQQALSAAATAEAARLEAESARAQAEQAREIANARQLKAQATALLDQQYDLALLLAVESEKQAPGGRDGAGDGMEHVLVNALEHNPRLLAYLRGHQAPVTSLALNADGTSMVSGDQDGGLILWDLRKSPPEARPLPAHRAPVLRLGFVAGGSYFVSAAFPFEELGENEQSTAEAMLWDARTGELLRVLSIGQLPGADQIAISEDGQTLAIDYHAGIAFWDVRADRMIGQPIPAEEILALAPPGFAFRSYQYVVDELAFIQGDRTLAVAMVSSAALFDVRSGQLVRRPDQRLHANSLTSLAADRSGRWLVTSSFDGTRGALNLETNESSALPAGPSWFLPIHGNSFRVKRGLALHPSLPVAALGSPEGTVTLWDLNKQAATAELHDRDSDVLSLAFSGDGNFFAAGGLDQTILLYRYEAGPRLSTPLPGFANRVTGAVFSPDGRLLAAADDQREAQVVLMEANTRKVLHRFPAGTQVMALAFDASGQRLMAAFGRGITIWDTQTYALLEQFEYGPLSVVAVDPGFTTLASLGKGQLKLVLYDIASRSYLPDLNLPALALDFSSDGQRLAVLDEGGTITVLDTATWSALFTASTGQATPFAALAFSPDDRLLVAGSTSLLAWDARSGQPQGAISDRHQSVMRLAFNANGSMLAAGLENGQVLLFDPRARGEAALLGRLPTGYTNYVEAVSFHPSLPLLVTGGVSPGRALQLWNLDFQRAACAVANRNLTEEEWARYLAGQPYERTCR